jgi:hypothetical protein
VLCNLAWGNFFWRVFLFVGWAALWFWLFTIKFSIEEKKQNQSAACGMVQKA